MHALAKYVLAAFLANIFEPSLATGSTKMQQTLYTSVNINSDNNRDPDDEPIVFPERSGNYHHHHHHNYPTPVQHHHLLDYEDSDVNMNARSSTEPPKFRNVFENATRVPLELLEKLNNNKYTVNDLLLHYVDDYEDDEFLQSRFGEEERRNVLFPKDAKCIPELRTVKLASSEDASVVYIPSCTRIERCGGCCTHSLLECRATEVETVNYQVIKTQYTGASKLKFLEKEIIQVEKHKKCACDCRIQPEDCTTVQEYRKNECRCICRNRDEEKKCYKSNETRLWDPESCSCKCREEKVCSTGSAFDWNQCRCVLIPMKRRFAEYPRKRVGYKSEAMPVIPLQHNVN